MVNADILQAYGSYQIGNAIYAWHIAQHLACVKTN